MEQNRRTVKIEADSPDMAYEQIDEMISEGVIDLPCDGNDYAYERFLTVDEKGM